MKEALGTAEFFLSFKIKIKATYTHFHTKLVLEG